MNYYAVAFVGIVGIVCLGVDYQQQSVQAGVPLGSLTATDYVDTITGRFDGVKAERLADKQKQEKRRAWKAGPRPHLPQAPDGWVRRAFNEGNNDAVIPASVRRSRPGVHAATRYLERARPDSAAGAKSKQAAGVMNLMDQRSAADFIKLVSERSWVYENGNETVFVEVTQRGGANLNTLHGNIAAQLSAGALRSVDGRDIGFGVIGGVPFLEAVNSDGSRSNHYRILTAVLGFGQEISIRVHANASSASTREVLAAIDFDGLNNMLHTPMATVGNEMTPPPGVNEAVLAEKMLRLRGEFEGLRSREAAYRLRNMNGGALLVGALAGGKMSDGLAELTSGETVSMAKLIDSGYRKAMRDLMQGRELDGAAGELGTMLTDATAQHQAAAHAEAKAAPENVPVAARMSPELAAELGVSMPESGSGPMIPVNMPSYKPHDLAPYERNWLKKNRDAAEYHKDGPDQDAARLMELYQGKPPGSCVHDRTKNRVHCDDRADAYRVNRDARPAQKSAKGGGIMSSISSLFKSKTYMDDGKTAAPSKEVVIRKGVGGGKKLGQGCSAGQFCKVTN